MVVMSIAHAVGRVGLVRRCDAAAIAPRYRSPVAPAGQGTLALSALERRAHTTGAVGWGRASGPGFAFCRREALWSISCLFNRHPFS